MIRNFLFHRVNPTRERLWDPMDVDLFDRCVGYIKRHYDIVQLEDAFARGTLHDQGEFATILFDDGYKDNIEYAAPVLAAHGVKASFYVVTDCVDRNVPTWTHVLEHSFQSTALSGIRLDFDFLPASLRVRTLPTREDRIRYIGRLKPFVKTLPHEAKTAVIDRVTESFYDVELPRVMMSWDDLAQLKQAGHCIGSHTVHHGMLGTMTDQEAVRRELVDSAAALRDRLGHFPVTISYPVGSYNETTKALSKEAGYRLGLAVRQELFDPGRDDLFEIPRIELYNEPWWKTRLRITHTLERVKQIIRYK